MFFFANTTTSKAVRGFAIVELLVTIALITLVTGAILFNYSSFNNGVLLRSQAYEVALDVREAQVYSVSVRSDRGEFDEEYGIYFSTSASDQYIFFQDSGASPVLARYNSGEAIGGPLFLDSRYKIKSITTVDTTGSTRSADNVSVTFKRPNFDARMWVSGAGSHEAVSAQIEITPLDESGSAFVTIYNSGQVEVQS